MKNKKEGLKIFFSLFMVSFLWSGVLYAENMYISAFMGSEDYADYSPTIYKGAAVGSSLESLYPKAGVEVEYTASDIHSIKRSRGGVDYTLDLKINTTSLLGYYEVVSFGSLWGFEDAIVRLKAGVSYLSISNIPTDYDQSELTISEKKASVTSFSYGTQIQFRAMESSGFDIKIHKHHSDMFNAGIGYSYYF